MVILDSNAIIYLSKEIITIDDIFIDENEIYAISVITYMEVLGYKFNSYEEEGFIKNLLNNFKIIYIDEEITNKVIELRKHHQIKLPDAIISATSLVNDAILFTNDIRLQTISNLKIKLLKI